MSSTEALRTQNDNLRLEMQRLEVENARLRSDRPEAAAEIDAEAETARLRTENQRLATEHARTQGLYDQLLADMQDEQARAAESERRVQELEEHGRAADREEVERLRKLLDERVAAFEEAQRQWEHRQRDAELDHYRTVEAERKRWEAREDRLVRQLEEAEARGHAHWADRGHVPVVTVTTPRRDPLCLEDSHDLSEQRAEMVDEGENQSPRATVRGGSPSSATVRGSQIVTGSQLSEARAPEGQPSSASTTEEGLNTGGAAHVAVATTGPLTAMSLPPAAWSAALLAQQLPPLTKFSGESVETEGESFREWKEQFEMVAELCQWDDKAKLANLTTRLRGQAYAFVHSLSAQQRSSYQLMIEQLTKRFTPVRLQAVQSSLFHERRQKPKETVDEYAQDLRRLFHKAYPSTQQGSAEAESMGRSVLAYQFVAGLRNELKLKVSGCEGTFEELLMKARFQEAKLRDLSEDTTAKGSSRKTGESAHPGVTQSSHPRGREPASGDKSRGKSAGPIRCHSCGYTGHIAKYCRWRGNRAPEEARGRTKPLPTDGKVAAVSASEDSPTRPPSKEQHETVAELRRKLQAAEVNEALKKVAATLHGVTPTENTSNVQLGPVVTAEVAFEGAPVQALLDTGSPVTIVSLDFALKAMAKQRRAEQTAHQWQEETKARLQPPTLALQSYGGGAINIVSQLNASISRGSHSVNGLVQIQSGAPIDLLLGTDLLPRLGFLFLEPGVKERREATDLLGGGSWNIHQERLPSAPHPTPGISTEAQTQAGTEGTPSETSQPIPTVRLIQATRVPARHGKYVRAQVEGITKETLSLFEPIGHCPDQQGIVMEDGAIELDSSGHVTLPIENRSLTPVYLEKGFVLGHLLPATVLKPTAEKLQETLKLTSDVESRRPRTGDMQHGDEVGVQSVSTQSAERLEKLLSTIQVESADISMEQQSQVHMLIEKFSDMFALDSFELGSTDVVQHSIHTGDHPPVRQPARRIPFALRGKVEQMVTEMLEQGVIQPSKSPWASPVVLVAKKDGSTRFCIDYRRLNAITKLDVFPLPRIDDSLDLLANSHFFSTLDLAAGYWQVCMEEESKEKTAFTTHSGLYEFSVMPFGLCNAPATFQRLMETVLAGLIRQSCLAYMDDVLVVGRTFAEHINNLTQVLERLREAGLRLKPSKCRFLKKEVEYLGYVVSQQGISTDPKKVEAVRNFPVPTDLKSLRSFLGLSSYYRRFIRDFSKVANPLFALTRKDTPFCWTSTCQEAFEKLKSILTEAPVLTFPDFTKDFILETDASGTGSVRS